MPLDDWSILIYRGEMNAKTKDTRQHILNTGYELVVNKGFTAVGLSELLRAAGVPKGSFYHYFQSKEQFGEALIADYFANYIERVDTLFSDPGLNSKQKLIGYFSRWLEIENGICNANKCLVVKLSAEVADLSESMRITLAVGTERIVDQLSQCIAEGARDGSIHTLNPDGLARQLYQMWLGASLLNKLTHDCSNLKQSLDVTEALLNT